MAAEEIPSTPAARVLIVEDESHLATALKLNFELEGYQVGLASTAREASASLLAQRYEVIILDVMLPDIDGFELCARLRQAGNLTPVLMLTARGRAEDRVRGIDVGADDYVAKPFALEELLARVRSLLRRRAWDGHPDTPGHNDIGEFGEAWINFATHEVRMQGSRLQLTTLELELLAYMLRNPHRVLSRAELLENVWRLPNYPNSRTVDNFVARLRKYFENEPSSPRYFISVRGSGYKFVP